MMEVYLLGTGGMKPVPSRALTGLWVEYGKKAYMVDCGEGMQVSVSKCGRSLAKLEKMFITHFHADHTAGIPGLLLSAGNFGKTSPLHIYAPEGAGYFLEGLLRICGGLPFDVIVHELCRDGGEIEDEGITVRYMPVRHRIPCMCYSFTEKRLPVFDPEKAKRLDIPVEYWKRLHRGESIRIGDRVISPEMAVGERREPLKVTYITDTVYFEGLIDFAADSDLLICEGMYGDDEYIPKMQEKGHMVFSQSAGIAQSSGSKELWLTHYSPALTEPEEYSEFVKGIFENTVISTDGIHKTIK